LSTLNLDRLARIPALTGFTEDETASFFQIASKHRFKAGEIIVKAGDRAYCFYLLAGGQVELSLINGAETVPIAQLGQGNLIGEMPLVYSQSVQMVNVKALQATTVLRFNYGDYGKLVQKFPELARKFCANVAGRSPRANAIWKPPVDQLKRWTEIMRKVELFNGLDEEHLVSLAQIAIPVAVKAGEPIMSAGDPPTGFYLILDGLAEVQNKTNEKVTTLARLGPSMVLGEMELIYKQSGRIATVMAVNDVRLWYFPLDDYNRLSNQLPTMAKVIRATLAKIAASRSWSMPVSDEAKI
jgi:CRP-like cAMP-binding protein